MREKKFRAWSKKDNCWIGGFCIHQSGLFFELINAKIEEPQHIAVSDAHWQDLKKQDDIILVQYTGLEDKNGKEIYEGDILEGTGFNEKKATWKAAPLESFHHWEETQDLMEQYGDIEVIGNIYENPDLLKK